MSYVLFLAVFMPVCENIGLRDTGCKKIKRTAALKHCSCYKVMGLCKALHIVVRKSSQECVPNGTKEKIFTAMRF